MAGDDEERIVMTPKKKTSNSTTLLMERKSISTLRDGDDKVHVAGGTNRGIVVNKRQLSHSGDIQEPAQLSLEFRVFLVNATTRKYTQEKRLLSYWFKEDFPLPLRASAAQDFFKKLVSPVDFPRDYVGFIKKIMKLLQKDYPMMSQLEVQLTQEKEMEKLPNRPTEEKEKTEKVTTEQLLVAIEQSYPNSLTVDDMAKRFTVEKELVKNMMMELVSRKVVKQVGVVGVPGVDSSATAYRRTHQDEDAVTVVKQMPRVERAFQPTIAVITSQYHEKLAVDAVMTNKQTFVRYATVGEANVYTLGDLGSHRVVTTKLPITGHGRDALIASGSTTTRLLGTFGGVEHVFLVGAASAVPHFTDFDQHVRLGDVVVSAPPSKDQRYIYQYCENVNLSPGGGLKFETRSWCPVDLGLQELAKSLVQEYESNPAEAPWLRHFQSALSALKAEGQPEEAWQRPPAESDKLYMSVGGGDVIEVGHPQPRDGREDLRVFGKPKIHFGSVAAGRQVVEDDQLRQEFSARHGTKCFDAELDAVVESIYGNRKDQYMLIRGAAAYGGDGDDEWRLHASLMAAAVLRAVVEAMPEPDAVS